jgi:hypothetical protein
MAVGLETPLPPELPAVAETSDAAEVEGGGASPSPQPKAPTPSPFPSDLPDFAKKADDLEAIKEASDAP